jgi:hypothetical protein
MQLFFASNEGGSENLTPATLLSLKWQIPVALTSNNLTANSSTGILLNPNNIEKSWRRAAEQTLPVSQLNEKGYQLLLGKLVME